MDLHYPTDMPVDIKTGDKFGVKRPWLPESQKAYRDIPHSGVDLRPHEFGGSRNVYAVADGRVTQNTKKENSYIAIDHGGGLQTLYVHLVERIAPINSKVIKGQLIGRYSDHLHFTIRQNGANQNPENYFTFTDMFKDKMLEELKNNTFGFSPEDQRAFINAVNDNNPAHILIWAGSEARKSTVNLINEKNALQARINQLQEQVITPEELNRIRAEASEKAIKEYLASLPNTTDTIEDQSTAPAPILSTPTPPDFSSLITEPVVIPNITVISKKWYESKKFLINLLNLIVTTGIPTLATLTPLLSLMGDVTIFNYVLTGADILAIIVAITNLTNIIYLLVQGKQDWTQSARQISETFADMQSKFKFKKLK